MLDIVTVVGGVFVPKTEVPNSVRVGGGVPSKGGGDCKVEFMKREVCRYSQEAGNGGIHCFAKNNFDEVVGKLG